MARNKEFDEKEALRKAMELFWQQGYEKTSMNDLVNHMGVHRRSIYDTFGDKRTLFMSALTHYEEVIMMKMKKKIESELPVKQVIREVFEMVIYPNNNQPIGCFSVNAAVELSLLDQEVTTKITEMFTKTETLFYELLKHGQEQGEISKRHDIKGLSHYLHNALVGIRVLVKTTDDKQKLETIIDLTLSALE
ncbi:MAG: TetR/AcrR family transcriptional regulator [Bacillota bacterium]